MCINGSPVNEARRPKTEKTLRPKTDREDLEAKNKDLEAKKQAEKTWRPKTDKEDLEAKNRWKRPGRQANGPTAACTERTCKWALCSHSNIPLTDLEFHSIGLI